MDPAVGLLEFASIAKGIEAGDAMTKRAPLEVVRAGTVHPGKYVVLVGGLTADVEEAMQAGQEVAGAAVLDRVFLADVHPDVVASIGGARRADDGEAIGVIETLTVAATIDAADAGIKSARVTIRELRLADDLGGKAYVVFGGEVAEVEAAVDSGVERVAGSGQEVGHVVIARLHAEMRDNPLADPTFGARIDGVDKPPAAPLALSSAAQGGRPLPRSGGPGGQGGQGAEPAPPRPPRIRRAGRGRAKKG